MTPRVHYLNNGREYEQSLRDRGDITLWISPKTISAWRAPMTGKRGAQPIGADIAIDTALALRLLFHPPLRQTEGFLQSVLKLMGLVLPCPDHTTLSRRNATVAIRRQVERAPYSQNTRTHCFTGGSVPTALLFRLSSDP